MAADAIPKSRYLGNGLTNRHNIWHDDAHWPSEPDQQLKFRTFKKSKMAERRTLEKLQKRRINKQY